MEELKDASIHHTAIKISNDIKSMKLYNNLFKMVQVFSIFIFLIMFNFKIRHLNLYYIPHYIEIGLFATCR